jgi:hypothetical protein
MQISLTTLSLSLSLGMALMLAGCGAEAPSGGAGGTSAGSAPAASENPGARLVFENPILNFGEVWDTENMVGAFPFKNTGDAQLEITEIKPSCGCTATKLDPMSYAPGTGNSIDVVWEPKGFGVQSKTIIVRSNAVGEGIEMLTIRANIQPFARFDGSAVDLGTLEHGAAHRHPMVLTCVDPEFELLELTSSSKWVTAEALGRRSDGSYDVAIALDPGAPWGMLNMTITAKVRGRQQAAAELLEHSTEVRLQGSLIHKLEVSPLIFGVGHVLPGRSFDRSIRLRHTDNAMFKVTKAELLNPVPKDMEVLIEPFKIGFKNGVVLRVKGQSGDYMGLIRAQVRFETDILGEQPHVISVMGIVRE